MKKCAEETLDSVLDLNEVLEDGQCILTKDNQDELIVLDYEKYQYLLQVLAMQEDNEGALTLDKVSPVGVKIVSEQDIELSDEEFDQLKEQLIEALETSFKHKEKRKEELN